MIKNVTKAVTPNNKVKKSFLSLWNKNGIGTSACWKRFGQHTFHSALYWFGTGLTDRPAQVGKKTSVKTSSSFAAG